MARLEAANQSAALLSRGGTMSRLLSFDRNRRWQQSKTDGQAAEQEDQNLFRHILIGSI